MKHLQAVAALAALTVSAAAAQAGTITAASGPFRVNAKDVTLASGQTLVTKTGDEISTGKSSVVWRSDNGDNVTLDLGTVAREEPTTQETAAIFVLRGSAAGMVGEKTVVGVAAGWAGAAKGNRAKVLVEATPGREASEGLFRAVEGSAVVNYRQYATLLPTAHSVTLDIDRAAPGALWFRTGQQNAGDVEIHKTVREGQPDEIVLWVPKATSGAFTDEPQDKTKICDDVNSLKTAKIRIETRFQAKGKNNASIGPGTCAVVDNATGAIQLLFTAVRFEILERAISLTTEFSTLAQSNFSDVK
jgi:hypothetical protein